MILIHPFKVPAILKKLYPGFEWEQSSENPNVYLTFDDGPHPEITPWVLDVLAQYQAKATFFLVGENAEKYPEVVKMILNAGHSIGNHTHNHIKGWNHTPFSYVHNTLKAIPHSSSVLFRPPYGRITRSQGNLLKSKGFRIVMWSLLSCDYLQNLDRNKALAMMNLHSKSGSIVVFHDSLKAKANLQWLLPKYLEFIQSKGMEFAAL